MTGSHGSIGWLVLVYWNGTPHASTSTKRTLTLVYPD